MFKYQLDQKVYVNSGQKFKEGKIFGRKFVDYAEKITEEDLEAFRLNPYASKFQFGKYGLNTLRYVVLYPDGCVKTHAEAEIHASIFDGIIAILKNSLS